MELSIGKNIRRLRGDAGLTQEELAQALSISSQSVSKWERGEGYPDITALPGLARFFGVTLDELMGMDDWDDYRFYSRMNNLEKAGRYDEAEQLARGMSKAFPNRTRGALANTLMLAGKNAKEAIALYEQVLAVGVTEKHRASIRASLPLLYAQDSQHEKALALARTLPHIWESREVLLTQFLPEEERTAHTRMAVLVGLSLLGRKIEGAGDWEKVVGLGICTEDVDWRGLLGKIEGYLG